MLRGYVDVTDVPFTRDSHLAGYEQALSHMSWVPIDKRVDKLRQFHCDVSLHYPLEQHR